MEVLITLIPTIVHFAMDYFQIKVQKIGDPNKIKDIIYIGVICFGLSIITRSPITIHDAIGVASDGLLAAAIHLMFFDSLIAVYALNKKWDYLGNTTNWWDQMLSKFNSYALVTIKVLILILSGSVYYWVNY